MAAVERRWRGAQVDDRTFEKPFRTFLLHSIGRGGKDLRDDAGFAPGYDVLGSSSGALDLGMGGGHVNFNAVVQGEVGRSTMCI